MNIDSFKNQKLFEIKEKDENGRIIAYTFINNIQVIGRNQFYPNILFYQNHNQNNGDDSIINPYDEKIYFDYSISLLYNNQRVLSFFINFYYFFFIIFFFFQIVLSFHNKL